jgi:anti-sigma factor RsiW
VSSLQGPEHPFLLGAYVLGQLDREESATVRHHLEHCAVCRDELAALEAVKRDLDSAPPELVLEQLDLDLDAASGIDDELLLRRTLRQMRAESGQRQGGRQRRGRALAVAAAVVLLGLGAGVGIAVDRAITPPAVQSTSPSFAALGQHTDPQTGIGLTAQYADAPGWVRLQVRVSGAPVGATCRLFAVGRDGSRQEAGSWVIAKPGGVARPVEVAVAIPRSELSQLELESGTGTHWVTIDL